MRTLAYFAVSPDTPALEEQQAAYKDFCHRNGHQSHGTFTDRLDDGQDDRPEFQRLLDHLHSAGGGFLVAITDPRCLGHDLETAVDRALRIEAAGGDLTTTDPDYPDPLQAALARWGSAAADAVRGQRIREAMQAKAMRGEGLGKPPYGYRIDDTGQLQPVPHEAEVVRLIYRLYANDALGIRRIARLLNEAGHTTRRGSPWSMVTIRDILRNRAYLGTYTRFGMRVPGNHPALIDRDLFRRVQDRMHSRTPRRGPQHHQPFLLSGLLYCAACGNRMMGVTRRQSWKRADGTRRQGLYRYYQCQSRTNRSICSYNTARASDLEDRVRRDLIHLLARHGTASPTPPTSSDDAQATLRILERRFRRHLRQAAQHSTTTASLRQALDDLRAYRQQLQSNGTHALTPNGDDALPDLPTTLTQDWDQLDIQRRQAILRSLVARIDLTEEGPVITLR